MIRTPRFRIALSGLLVSCCLLAACEKPHPPAPSAATPTQSPDPTTSAALATETQQATTPPAVDPTATTQPSAEESEVPPIRGDGTIYGEAEMMGTHVSINVWVGEGGDARSAGKAVTDAFYEIARIESIASEWQATSDISRMNEAAGGDFIDVAPELVEILKRSQEVSAATKGLFDVTFHGVGKLWHFQPGSQPPTDKEIKEKLSLINYRDIEFRGDRQVRLKRAGMAAGLGAIAKGYAVDRASNILRERGLVNHIVEGGGDTFVSGTKNGKPWNVGVQEPSGAGTTGIIPSSNEAIVTSGNYERFFVYNGIHYAHILDPKTGKPVLYSESPRSVTLVANNATDADAYCTAVSIMGAKKGMAFVEKMPGLEAVIIDAKGKVTISSGLKSRYQPSSK